MKEVPFYGRYRNAFLFSSTRFSLLRGSCGDSRVAQTHPLPFPFFDSGDDNKIEAFTVCQGLESRRQKCHPNAAKRGKVPLEGDSNTKIRMPSIFLSLDFPISLSPLLALMVYRSDLKVFFSFSKLLEGKVR